jgi:predicted Zn-dependent peptidase
MTPRDAAAQKPDRTARPLPLPSPELVLPDIQKAVLSDGLTIWLVESHKLPQVALNMVIGAGSDREPPAAPGIAALTAEVMDAGTASQSALQIAERIDFIGASMSVRGGVDASFATLNTLSRHLDEALAVFGDVLTRPSFPSPEVERLRSQRITALLQQKDRAAVIASLAFNKILYGPGHPYGNDPSGTESSLKRLRRKDLAEFYRTWYRPNNATLIVVGDVTFPAFLPKLETTFAPWRTAVVPALRFPPVPAAQRRRVCLIDKPGAPQSEIRIGRPALARDTPDYFPVLVMNRILGGQFSSRMNMNLRERRGFTYGARSSFAFSRQPGPFYAGGAFFTANTDSALRELVHELETMRREGLTAGELEFSKKGLTGAFAQTFETASQIAFALQILVLYGLPEDYYRDFLRNIEKVSLEDVRRVAASYLDPAAMDVVVVGDVQAIRPGIERLGLGDVELCDSEGARLV